ncbi:MAG: type II secretion system protein [Candidatus Zambryskibacteria bacterium]|nr:type II secretion system protein [Candidatus Zambryskibacteria bacterium]
MEVTSKQKGIQTKKGFTLVELMVSVSVFVIIMVISMGSILSIFDANRKSQSLRTVMDNLNFTMEAMTRTIRFGTNYHCDATLGDISTPAPRDCNLGASSIVVKASDGKKVAYKLSDGRITRSINGGVDYFVTSSDVTITDLKFRVVGSTPYSVGNDLYQPQAIITISGFSGIKATTKSSFSLETTVSQRMFDSQ